MANLDSFISTMHSRLAAVESKLGLPTPAAPAVGSGASSSSAGGGAATVTKYDESVASKVASFVETSKKLGGPIEKLGTDFGNVSSKLRDIIVFASEYKKPASDTEFMKSLMQAMQDLQKDAKDANNHGKAVVEALPAFAWVNPAMKLPVPYITEMADASVFWANKVKTEWKGKDGGADHLTWCTQLNDIIRSLGVYVKENFPTGLTWNPKGGAPPSEVAPSAGAPAPAAASSTAPAAAAGFSAVNLAAELSKLDQSSGKTAGLKHVTKEMKSKNNDAPPVEKKAPAAKKEEPAPKVQVFALQGNKWVVEGQTSTINIAADQVSVKHSVYIYNCVGATIIVDGKCNTITIDNCKKTSVIFQDVLALCETVNSKTIKVQCKGKAPTVSIDKTDGIVVYLSRDTMYETKIVASKSSEMNVQFPGKTDDDAWIEKVIPEQYVHHIQKDDTVSAEVSDLYSHGG